MQVVTDSLPTQNPDLPLLNNPRQTLGCLANIDLHSQ